MANSFLGTVLSLIALCAPAAGINISVDYTYDTNSFFDTQAKKDAMESAAARWSRIITSNLDAVNLVDDSNDQRIGFSHPGTGASYQVSSAASSASDLVNLVGGGEADEYRGAWSIPADTWILYAGGRELGGHAGEGGTATGTNFTSVLNDWDSVMNRGFNRGSGTLPVWGGAITFDTTLSWHFDVDSAAPGGTVDFYTIAVHEIAHALGLAVDFDDFSDNVSGNLYNGANVVAAYNVDNGASESSIDLESFTDLHWENDAYTSEIFPYGSPNYVGTVGAGNPQDLLMDPEANFTASVRRLELTNVDVASAMDIGWATVPEPSTGAMVATTLIPLIVARRRRGGS